MKKMKKNKAQGMMTLPPIPTFTPRSICRLLGFVDAFFGTIRPLHENEEGQLIYGSCFSDTRIASIKTVKCLMESRFRDGYAEEAVQILQLSAKIAEYDANMENENEVAKLRLRMKRERLKESQNTLVSKYILPVENYAESYMKMLQTKYEAQLSYYFSAAVRGAKVGTFLQKRFKLLLTENLDDLDPEINKQIRELMTKEERKYYETPIELSQLFKNNSTFDETMSFVHDRGRGKRSGASYYGK